MLASAVEILKEKSFARCTPEELAQLAELMARVELAVPKRRSRRRQKARGQAPPICAARSAARSGRAASRSSGPGASGGSRPRRLVLFLDVSGSMASYSRALLVFAYAALRADPRWEAYCFGTRLTRLTRVLGPRRPRRGAAGGRGRGVRLGRWHADRRVAQALPRHRRPDRARLGRDHLLGRARGRRPERARGPDGPALAARLPGHLAQPAEGGPGVRAARPRHGRLPARTSTSSSAGTTSRASRRSPTSSFGSRGRADGSAGRDPRSRARRARTGFERSAPHSGRRGRPRRGSRAERGGHNSRSRTGSGRRGRPRHGSRAERGGHNSRSRTGSDGSAGRMFGARHVPGTCLAPMAWPWPPFPPVCPAFSRCLGPSCGEIRVVRCQARAWHVPGTGGDARPR